MAKYSNYITIIEKAITDFNSIFDALRDKSVVNGASALNQNTTGIKTEDYAGLIRNQLFRVSGVTSSSGVTNTNGVIPNYAGSSITLSNNPTVSYNYSEDKVTLGFSLNSNGYYSTGSSFSKTIGGTAVTLSGTLLTTGGTNYSYGSGYYTVTSGNGKILTKVNVKEGSISLNSGTINVTNALSVSTTDPTGNGVNIANALLAKNNDAFVVGTSEPTGTSTYYIAFKPTSSGGSANITASVTDGYLNSQSPTGTVSTSHSNSTIYYYTVNRAELTRNANKFKVTTAGFSPLNDEYTMPDADGYTLSLANKSNQTITVGSYNSTGSTYPISISPTLTGTIGASTPGYYDGSNKTANASVTVSGTIAAASFGGSTATGNKTISSNTYSVGAGYTGTRTLTVRNSNTSVSAALTAQVTNRSDSLTAEALDGSSNPISIFLNSAPESGDYYTLTATASNTVTQSGWIETAAGSSTDTKYLPKAVLEYTTDSASGADLLTVTTGGYLPAGIIGNVAPISGTLDQATFNNLTLSTTPSGSGPYVFSGTVTLGSPGYVLTTTTMPTATLTLPKATFTGGGLSTAAYTGSGSDDISNTLSTSDSTYTVGSSSYSFTVTGTKSSVSRAAVKSQTSGAGYFPADTQVLGTGSKIVGTTSKTFYIREGSRGALSSAVTFGSRTTATTASGQHARTYATTSTSGLGGTYVKVDATPSASEAAGTNGWTNNSSRGPTTGTLVSTYIKAIKDPSVTVEGTLTDSTSETTFNTTTGAISTAGSKTVSGTLTGGTTNIYPDYYIIGGLDITTINPGSITINVDATGSDVDLALESLYKRTLGKSYNAVASDGSQGTGSGSGSSASVSTKPIILYYDDGTSETINAILG